MIKRLLSLLLTLVGTGTLYAGGLPDVSTNGHEVWYLIQFSNGGNAITAANNQANITTDVATGTDEQLWKVTGSEAEGYSLTNKKGYTLYTDQPAKNNMIKAASKAGQHHLFTFVKTTNGNYPGTYEIQPKGSASVAMNLWGGPAENRGVGLWSKGDPNNCVTFVSQKQFESVGKISLIPYPQQLEITKEGGLDLTKMKTIYAADKAMEPHLQAFVQQLATASGYQMNAQIGDGQNKDQAIHLVYDPSLPAEGYTLKVNDRNIVIKASQTAGFFYGLQTLKQLLPNVYFAKKEQKDVEWTVPFVDIKDQPTLGHRGFMLDVARHFFDKNEVMRILDVMAFYKMNIFHWHLTDDQGWRIEIPQYPKLTEVGSIRKSSFSNPGEGQQFFDDTEYGRGMWYTQKELKEVVAYAKERNIEIIPEVDFPGHMVAAVTAYPEFSCDPSKKYEVRVNSGISKDVLNIGNDQVIDFLKCIMDNLAEIFPYQYIHFGGDECPTDQWQNNADCLRRVKQEGLQGVHQLQSWLVEELGTYVKEKYNKDIMVWDELVEHWNTNNKIKPVVMAWRGLDKNANAANKGLKSITCPHEYLYLDMMQVTKNKTLIDEPYYGGWNDDKVVSVQTAYSINPTSSLGGRENFCMGVQANMWTETTNDNEELEYQLFPRLLAVSETAWLPASEKNWSSFYKRLQSHDEILDEMGVTYAKHYIEPAQLTEEEAEAQEARQILAESVRGGVGYPAADVYDALEKTLKKVSNTKKVRASQVATLKEAIENYKKAPIVQPEAGKIYQIVSASTYYKKQFAGSTLYQKDRSVKFHYTPQVEPEELWEFIPAEGGYYLQNVGSGDQIYMMVKNKPVNLRVKGTPIRVDKATIPNANYDYIPGTVTLSNVRGYKPTVTGSVNRLVAQLSGEVFVADDAKLSYPGTWKIVEVTDFHQQLQGLCQKCEAIVRDAVPGEVNQPSVSAIDFLKKEVIASAQKALEGTVTEAVYKQHMALYYEFLAMPKSSATDALDEGRYYFLQNAYFDNYYAAANTSNNKVEPKTLNRDGDHFYWRVEKQNDQSIRLINKANNQVAYVADKKENAEIKLAAQPSVNHLWTVEAITTDQGNGGLALVDGSGNYSWYTNPDAFGTVLLKPKNWGASIWNFVKTDVEVTGINDVHSDATAEVSYYDLNGRKVNHPENGVYVKSNGEKVLLP